MISERRLEAISVGILFYSPLLILIILLSFIPLALKFWPLTLLYFSWIYLDRNTPRSHGRSLDMVRKNPLWRYFRGYFPQTLVKIDDLDPKRNYILALAPHGIFTTSAFSHFFSETSDFYKLYPGIKVTPLTLSPNFNIPLFRDFLLASGACTCDKESIMYRLKNKKGGQAVLLVPGGAAEALLTVKGAYRLAINERKGFIKLAHQAGASVVPVFAFGETNTYSHINFPKDSLALKLQQYIKKVTGVAPCLAWGRSMFSKYFGILPHRTPVVTVVGRPIHLEKIDNPSEETINKSHEIFIKEMNNLFETHKHKYIPNPDNTHLLFQH